MTSRQIGRVNQQSKGETPLASGILQRAAVSSVAEQEVQESQEVESERFRESRFQHDFSQLPIRGGLPTIQAKLRIGAVGDRYEQEADRVAQEVVSRMNSPQGTTVQRENISVPEEELQKKPIVQRVVDAGEMAASPDLEASIQQSRGSGQPLAQSVREPMERAFGADFTGVRVHANAKSDKLNQSIQAKAFTTGQDIFFRQNAYEPGSSSGQELIAHELTHVLQQTGAVQKQLNVGKSQKQYQPLGASNIGIQRYIEFSNKSSNKYRVADDYSMLVKQDSKYGSQDLWAEAGKAKASSDLLALNKSVIRLHEVGSTINLKRKGVVFKQLTKVEPKNVSNKTSGTGSTGMSLWADCGKSARDVIGAGQGSGGGQPKAVYTDSSGKQTETSGTSSPASMKREILLTYIIFQEKTTAKTLIDKTKLAKFQQKRDQIGADYAAAKAAGKDKATIDDLVAKYFYWDEQITNAIVECYNTKISDKDREGIEKKAGINRWADPGVGQGYTISSGGAPKPGYEKNTWNFHWAGVVMKSHDGNDHTTLENYAVGDASIENREWVYQMYGSAKVAEVDSSKKGQTFHEQHRDVHGQHGETPTTMTVKP